MDELGEPVLDAMLMADNVEDMVEGILIALAVGELNTVVGEYGVNLVGYRGEQMTIDVGDRRLAMAQRAVHQIVQLMGEAGDEGLTAAEQFYTLAV